MADERPLRSKAFDALERAVIPLPGSAVRCQPFENVAIPQGDLESESSECAERSTPRAIHFWNPQANSDVKRVREQPIPLERQVRGLSKGLRDPEGTNGKRN
jgi:hypothetical protein